MKFSSSLLQDIEVGQNIFDKSIQKTKNILLEIFGLDFEKNNSQIKKIIQDDDLYQYNVIFELNDRKIRAELTFEPIKESQMDIVQEVLKIHENVEEKFIFNNLSKDYKKAINRVMDFLEEKYELNFISLDPEEKEKKIKSIKENDFEKSWQVIFTHEDHEAEYTSIFFYKQERSSLVVVQHKQHRIYLE